MNLATNYLGLKLRNPLVVGASPLCDDVGTARQLEEAGAAAVVMRSLFEEQFTSSGPADGPAYSWSRATYVEQLGRLKGALTIPVIASLNGAAPGRWTETARVLAGAGADAIELNCYRVVTETTTGPDQVEMEILRAVRELASAVELPIAVKLSPYHTALAQFATALELAGADGIVAFNRFYQPDFDIDELAVNSHLRLSDPSELLLRLRWLAILSPQVRCSLAAGGGIHRSEDMVKALLAGAQCVQVVSALLQQGPHVLGRLLAGLRDWMDRRGFRELDEFRGRLNLANCADPSALERANYIRVLQSWRTS